MRLHRLLLRDFRAIAEREIHFAERGVTVVEGANEVGKSSMIEALDLLLQKRSDSRSAVVRSVMPVGRDVGSIIEAEISCGDYRFVYRKQFNRAHRTELIVVSPRPQQLAGRDAEQWVQRVLGDEVDMALYSALRLVQGVATEPVALAGSGALARALDAAAAPSADPGCGAAGDASGGLIGAAAAEYERYYTTGLGKPARELAGAMAAADEARALEQTRRAAFEEARADMDALDDAVTRHAELARAHELARVELAQVEQEHAAAAEVVRRREVARADLAAARARAELAARSRDQRERAARRRDELADQVQSSEQRIEEFSQSLAACDAESAAAETDLVASRLELTDAESAVQLAVDAARRRADSEQMQVLNSIIERVDASAADQNSARERLAQLPVDDAALTRLSELTTVEAVARAAKDAVAPHVRVELLGDRPVLIDDESCAGTADLAVSAETVIEVDGVVRVRIDPGADVRGRDEAHARAAAELASVLAELRVADMAAAHEGALERARLQQVIEALAAEERAVLAGRDSTDIRAELAQVRARVGDDAPAHDGDELDVDQAEERATVARERLAEVQRQMELCTVRRASLAAQVSMLTTQRDASAAELHRVDDELSAAATIPDESSTAALESASRAVRAADDELATRDIDGIAMRRDNLADLVNGGGDELAALAARVTELSTRVDVRADEGRFDQLSAAETELAAAEDHLQRVQARADAARVLLDALTRHRDEARNRYVQPFTDAVERLGRVVFGPSFSVEVDQELQVVSRTLDGSTVPLEHLSGGAKEQLGIIIRLACAMVVDPVDGVPVIIDDALGYSDPRRLETVGTVLRHAGQECQIIVLTCTPGRYRTVGGARMVSL